ncbi:hypothetical protein BJ322DRAFT_1099898 [Thelephora terrestris]|uniref:Uncharacterized protein n=1 Tax=Thelephora terrestris TaxID=56493 RepID=A0A9P6HFV2_9AGAM|nr:hypothetical protein BJ322DRAFT_1099898 [Thelephora terrestris]
MPEISSTPPAGPDDETSCVFKNFRRLGLAYLDENGEKLEFLAGNDANGDEGGQSQSEEDEALESDFSDMSESDGADAQPKRVVRDGGLGKYWPYPSKTVNTPSLYALRETQKKLADKMDIQPHEHISALGTKFHAIAPEDLLALDWANPHVRKSMCLYPEIISSISEPWQTGKWCNEVPLDELSPMWADWEKFPERHFYVDEVARTKAGQYVLPKRWIIFNKEVCAEGHPVHFSERVGLLRFHLIGGSISSQSEQDHFERNPVRAIANGKPVFSLRVMPWADDVSGNRSKQYNPHVNIYMKNLNIPSEKLKQQFFVRFCSTSPDASSNEQFRAFLENCGHEKYIPAYDCLLQREILFRIFPHNLPADNPQHAESASGIGGNGNLNCIRDKSGGTKEQKESDEGYHALFAPGKTRRTVPETVQIIKEQINLACEGIACRVSDLQTETGLVRQRLHEPKTQDPRLGGKLKSDERKQIKEMIHSEISAEVSQWVIEQPPEKYKQLSQNSRERYVDSFPTHNACTTWTLKSSLIGLDPHQDSSIDLLHTILLGLDKYVWHKTSSAWNEKKGKLFSLRMNLASSLDGLSGSREDAEYLIRYKNNLVGRQFKFIQQLAVFHLRRDMCNDLIFDLWKATGELGALLWYPIINDMGQYLADLNVLIANVLDIWATVDTNRIIDKMKLHIITHLPEDIQRFGPAGLYIVEGFEGWNRIWRLCSIFSNHHSPSRDIAINTGGKGSNTQWCKLCKAERIKHLLSGGFWHDRDSKGYVQAGEAVRRMFESDKKLRRRLGWNQTAGLAPGKFISRLDCACNSDLAFVTQENGEEPIYRHTMVGRILKIAVTKTRREYVIMEDFNILESRDHRYGMPTMQANPEQRYQVVPPANISFLFNAQHDCEGGECGYTIDETGEHDGQPTAKTKRTITHSTHDKYFINTHALHNAYRLREVLPRSLMEPVPYVSNCEEFHHRMVRKLQKANPKKRARAKEKAKDTRERKKRAVESTGGIKDEGSEDEAQPAP